MTHLPGVAFMKDAEGRYLYINETLKEIYDAQVREWQGKTDDDVWPTDVAERLKANDRLVVTERTSLEMIEEVPQEDGVHHWLTIKFPIADASDQPGILGCIGVDITERIRIERELRTYREHLQDLVAERTDELVQVNEQLRREITERKQADEALRESELKFRSFFEQSLDGICLTDEEGSVIEWNQGQERITGLKQAKALGQPLWDILSLLSIEERRIPAVDEARKAGILTLLKTGWSGWSERLRELDIQRPDGEHRTVQQVIFPIMTDEGFLIGSTTRDITERKRAEEEVRRRARELTALNRAGRIIGSSLDLDEVLAQIMVETRAMLDAEGASVLLHDTDSDELIFTATAGPHSEALVGTRMPASAGIVGRALREAQAVLVRDAQDDPRFYDGIDAITRLTTRSALAVPLEYRGTVIGVLEAVNKAGRPFDEHDLGLLDTIAASAASAIANARLYEAEREQRELVERSQTQLINTEKMAALGRLAASIAHEINNPMQSVVGCLALAQQELAQGQDVEEYIQVALGEVRRVARTVGRMRDLYRPTSGKREPADVNELMEQVLTLTRKQCQQSQVEVVWGPAPDLPALPLSRDQITQVFLNLVLNALDAMPRGGRLEVSTAISTAPTGEPTGVKVTFSDTGAGIPADEMSAVFEPFYSTKPDGTGLGLSISYGIVEQHGGTIEMESAAGEGSTFTVWLPE
jgi:two-component system NtrC family sensor kinase